MSKFQMITLVFVFLVAGLATACADTKPYVHNKSEFDRKLVSFAKGVTNHSEVTVCFQKHGTMSQAIVDLAREECASFGKTAVFREQTYQVCPLVTPVAAVYDCVGATATSGFGSQGGFNVFDLRRNTQ